MSESNKELKKEFELERMILFSDAVFAIGITLLVIELKFPEIPEKATSKMLFYTFQPLFIHFFAFVLSFFYIGLMWARHLKMFKYLKDYNDGLIVRNLIFLFFVICFPFTASGFSETAHDEYAFTIFIYFGNIYFVTVAHFILSMYLFRQKKELCIPGHLPEKRYILLESMANTILLTFTLILMIIVYIIYGNNQEAILNCTIPMMVLLFISNRILKKYKPKKQ